MSHSNERTLRKLRPMCFGLLPFLVASFAALSTSAQDPADLILKNGTIITLETPGAVSAIAISGDRILATGTDGEISRLAGTGTRVIDMKGATAVPGFIEGHGHLMGLGDSLINLWLGDATSWDEIVKLVAERAEVTPPGEWIVGRGWHQEKWTQRPTPAVQGYPTHGRLSQMTPNHPVLLSHGSGHMCFANAKAMELAGIDSTTRDPVGGEILREPNGDATGAFRETAQGLVRAAHGKYQRTLARQQLTNRRLEAIEKAQQECLKHGITSFQDAGSSSATTALYRQLGQSGQLHIRLWIMLNDSNATLARNLAEQRTIGACDNFLTVRAIKRSVDGALGAHGAWLLKPYDDLPSSVGLNTTSLESLRRTAELAVEHNYQFCVHAIGDRANREILDLFEMIQQRRPSEQSRRWRIEHAQHVDPADIPRFGQLGVIASMQANHCTSDAVYVFRRLGLQRAREGAYVWKSLMDSGAIVTNGTDTPVEPVNPMGSFYASVTRRLSNGVQFFEEQTMTREQALRSYTIQNAYAAFEESIKGSLKPGKLADIAILSANPITVPDQQIQSIQVRCTIVGGKIAYARPGDRVFAIPQE